MNGRGPLPPLDGKVPARITWLFTVLQSTLEALPSTLRLQMAARLRAWLDNFEREARADFERAYPPQPPDDSGVPTYTTTGTSR